MLADREPHRRIEGSRARDPYPLLGLALTPRLDPEESNCRDRYRHCPNHVLLLQFAARARRDRFKRGSDVPAATAVRQVGKRLNRWKIRGGGARTYARMRRPETRFRGPDFTSVIGHWDVSIEGRVPGAVDPRPCRLRRSWR